MRFVNRVLRCAVVVVAALVVPSTPAVAQGLFQSLFGGPPKPQVQPLPPMPQGSVVLQPPGIPRRGERFDNFLRPGQRSYSPARGDVGDGVDLTERRSRSSDGEGGTYTTVCVRLCDGYYWPVRHASRRRDFQRDAKACEASCGESARLFYIPTRGGAIETAIDLSGKQYAKLPGALLYRTNLINGCACRPSPWSDSERMRHDDYARIEAEARRVAEEAAAAAALAAAIAGPAPPPGSFRAAQEIGMPDRNLRIATKKPAIGAPGASQVAAQVASAAASTPAIDSQPTEPRPRGAATRAAKTNLGPRPIVIGDVRPQRRIAQSQPSSSAAPLPAAFKPVSGFGGPSSGGSSGGFTWPGDAPRR
jgi:Protein of unknown function (DUF2865)